MNTALVRRGLLLGLLCVPFATVAAVPDLGGTCKAIEGKYQFRGETVPGSREQVVATDPTIALVLYPRSDLAYDRRIDWYRVVIDGGRPMLELHGRNGPIGRLPMAGVRDFAYCLDDELTIEQQRRSVAGSVYEYSRHRHRLRRSLAGDLLVETDIRGKFRSLLGTWKREPQHYTARFASLP